MLGIITLWSTLWNVVLFPPTWLHEQTHYAVYRPYVQSQEREWSPTGAEATLRLDVRGMPWWRYALGALAPTVIGFACAVLAAWVSLTPGVAASLPGDALGWLLAGAYWWTYTVPSAADLEEAVAAVLDGGDPR